MSIATLITIGVALVLFSGITIFAVKRVNKSSANAAKDEAALEKVDEGITIAQAASTAISPFLPDIDNKIISKTLDISQKAVVRSEATYKAATSTDPNAADTRKAEATSLVKSGLALEGIQDTPEIDKLINVAIPLLVLALPKTHDVKEVTAPADSAAASGATGAV